MFTPVDGWNLMPVFAVVLSITVVYFELSEKNASSAVTRLRRSDFIAVTYALFFVLANFGIAIAAKMQMMTTTISSSMSVKPFRARSMEDMNNSPWEKTAAAGPGRADPATSGKGNRQALNGVPCKTNGSQ